MIAKNNIVQNMLLGWFSFQIFRSVVRWFSKTAIPQCGETSWTMGFVWSLWKAPLVERTSVLHRFHHHLTQIFLTARPLLRASHLTERFDWPRPRLTGFCARSTTSVVRWVVRGSPARSSSFASLFALFGPSILSVLFHSFAIIRRIVITCIHSHQQSVWISSWKIFFSIANLLNDELLQFLACESQWIQ